ncbi:hypothetical protein GGS20DRAFT_126382 [Poronia punctata]|nr:hypothetical protein GGS20DRAFT_126382 [Poronia punctata]
MKVYALVVMAGWRGNSAQESGWYIMLAWALLVRVTNDMSRMVSGNKMMIIWKRGPSIGLPRHSLSLIPRGCKCKLWLWNTAYPEIKSELTRNCWVIFSSKQMHILHIHVPTMPLGLTHVVITKLDTFNNNKVISTMCQLK